LKAPTQSTVVTSTTTTTVRNKSSK